MVIFENDPELRSIPEIRHSQVFLYTAKKPGREAPPGARAALRKLRTLHEKRLPGWMEKYL